MKVVVAPVTALLAALALAVSLVRAPVHQHSASPSRIAGLYVKQLAKNAGVKILGDKVWSVHRYGDKYTVVVRVRYAYLPTFFGVPVSDQVQVGVTTIYVHLLKSSYVVTG